MTTIDPPTLVRADDAEVLGQGDDTMRLLVDGHGVAGVSAIRTRMGKGTDGPPPHSHHRAAEVFFIVDGGLHVLVGERVETVEAGDLLVVPPHTAHAFRTPQHTGVDMLFLMPNAARFDYFRMVDRIRRGLAEPREMFETQERFDNHFAESAVWRRFLNEAAGQA